MPSVPPDSLRSMANMPISDPYQLVYFGHHLTLSPPPLAPSAAIIITNRQEQVAIWYSEDLPANRTEADARGSQGATKQEWVEMNKFRKYAIGVQTPRAGGGCENLAGLENPPIGSKRWDHVFNRMRAVAHIIRDPSTPFVSTWFNTVYTPGMFSGFWLGRVVASTWILIGCVLNLTCPHTVPGCPHDSAHVSNASFSTFRHSGHASR